MDPQNGAVFYHQVEKPIEEAPAAVFATSPLLENWMEAFAKTTDTFLRAFCIEIIISLDVYVMIKQFDLFLYVLEIGYCYLVFSG